MISYTRAEEIANLQEYSYIYNSYVGSQLLESFIAHFSETDDPDFSEMDDPDFSGS